MYVLRWPIVFVWLVLLAVSAVFAPRVSGVLRGGGYTIGKSESVHAYNVLHHAYGYRALTFTAVITGPRGSKSLVRADAARFRREAALRFGHALRITRPVWTADQTTAFMRVYSAPQEDFGASFATPLRDMLPHGRVAGHLTGSAAVFHDMETVSNDDLRRIEVVTLPIALAVLLLIFGSVAASLVPILMAPIAVSISLALVYFPGPSHGHVHLRAQYHVDAGTRRCH